MHVGRKLDMHQLKATVPNPRLSGDGGDMSGSADYVFRVQRWAMKGFMDFLAWRSCTTSRVALVFRRWFYFLLFGVCGSGPDENRCARHSA